MALFIVGCGSHRVKVELDAEERYHLGKRLLDKGDCLEAVQEFQKVIFNFPGSDYVDDAEYGLGMAHYCAEEYALAASEFRRVLRDYPRSTYADDAQYMLGVCYFDQSMPTGLDQEFTQKAIEAFQKLLDDYPESELVDQAREKLGLSRDKLAKKDFDTGRLYLKLDYFQAAILSFEGILTQYPDSKWAAEAQYSLGEVYKNQKEYTKALSAYEKVVTNYPTEKVAEKAMKRIQEIR
ncbi:MAG: outer membrane protein assembly factor BamD [Gemmatimonadota bacterium]|nr:MAG: outer membrane protein assembly factor BamD [Gemmatimonadota bacterium]